MSSPTRRSVLQAGAAALLAAGCGATSRPAAADRPGGATGTGSPGTARTVPTRTPPAGSSGGAPVEIASGPRSSRAVALTFHGAGDPAVARTLLAEAARAHARITVLAVGSWLAAEPALARQILDAGHELGNHTYTHPALRRLPAAGVRREIAGCAQVLQRLTGSPGRWFRPSGTQHTTPLIAAEARRAGYASCLSYDVDSRDYTDPGAAAVARAVLSAVRPGSIVSLHFGHVGTVTALPLILDGLRSRGLAAVTVSALVDGSPG